MCPEGGRRHGQRILGLGLGLVAAVTAGCAVAPIATEQAEHGEVWALLQDDLDRRATTKGSSTRSAPLVVMIEKFAVRAVDPVSTDTLWRYPAPVSGHLVASESVILVPIEGRRLLAIERASGERLWEIVLPGEVIVGMSVDDNWAAITVAGMGDRRRSKLLMVSIADGSVRWQRGSVGRLGVPGVVHRHVVVPLDGELVVLSAVFGREKARLQLPEPTAIWGRVEVRHDAVAVAGFASWLNVSARGGRAQPQELLEPHAPVFTAPDGYDPGYDDNEGIRWWVPLRKNALGERGDGIRVAVLMARRAVVGVELDERGWPVRGRWAFLADPGHEQVALDVSYGRVNLLDETGGLTSLSLRDGRVIASVQDDLEIRGGLMLGMGNFEGLADKAPGEWFERMKLDAKAPVFQQLARIIHDSDPRILAAQRIAIDVLWRAGGEDGRREVRSIAVEDGVLNHHEGRSDLRLQAQQHIVDELGADAAKPGALDRLTLRPSFVESADLGDLPLLARRAVESGEAAWVVHLGALMLHPGTPAGDLDSLAQALCGFDQKEADAVLEKFLRCYHADSEQVLESRAMMTAAKCMVMRRHRRGEGSENAENVLRDIIEDSFTDPMLRNSIERDQRGLTSDPSLVQAVSKDEGDLVIDLDG